MKNRLKYKVLKKIEQLLSNLFFNEFKKTHRLQKYVFTECFKIKDGSVITQKTRKLKVLISKYA